MTLFYHGRARARGEKQPGCQRHPGAVRRVQTIRGSVVLPPRNSQPSAVTTTFWRRISMPTASLRTEAGQAERHAGGAGHIRCPRGAAARRRGPQPKPEPAKPGCTTQSDLPEAAAKASMASATLPALAPALTAERAASIMPWASSQAGPARPARRPRRGWRRRAR